MPAEEFPDWTTEMDLEILGALEPGLILTPAVIADNISRSREAVARRLNTLEAGGFVTKEDRGKYRITGIASFMLMDRPDVEFTDEDREEMMREIDEQERQMEEKFGMTVEEYERAIIEEYYRIRDETDGYRPSRELLRDATANVEEEAKMNQSGVQSNGEEDES